ncbi:MAG: PfkB family carbohydrate kinase [Hyphomonadaceae bacterium]
MRIDLDLAKARSGVIAMGAGFVALDVIQNDDGDRVAAGGTCGNVMAILAWLGWHSLPVARIGADGASECVIENLTAAGVDTRFVSVNTKTPTPIVIQRTVIDRAGKRSHRFTMTCPGCGQWLPRFRPFVGSDAQAVIDSMGKKAPNVFFFDRVSPAILTLARWARDAGALLMFEPTTYSDDKHFQSAVELCHILKFSHERLGHVRDFAETKGPEIAIETLGADGLRIRWRDKWTTYASFRAPRFIDAAGAGDWCAAGLLHVVGQSGAAGLKDLRKPEVEKAVRVGQALSAINCGFVGARGSMEVLDRAKTSELLRQLQGGEVILPADEGASDGEKAHAIICDVCKPPEVPRAKGKKRA